MLGWHAGKENGLWRLAVSSAALSSEDRQAESSVLCRPDLSFSLYDGSPKAERITQL